MKQLFLFAFVMLLFFGCRQEKNRDDETLYNIWKIIDFYSLESRVYAKKDNFNPIIEFGIIPLNWSRYREK